MKIIAALWMLMISAAASAGGIDTVIAPPAGYPRKGFA